MKRETKERVAGAVSPLPPWRYAVSLRVLAERTGRSKGHIARVLKGERIGSAELRALLKKIGVPPKKARAK